MRDVCTSKVFLAYLNGTTMDLHEMAVQGCILERFILNRGKAGASDYL